MTAPSARTRSGAVLREMRSSFQPPLSGYVMDLKKLRFREAEAFFDSYEHLGNCGLGVWHWGATEGGNLIGVVSFGTTCFARSRGTLSSIANQFGLAIYQICRGGTSHTAPPNTPSQILSEAMRELRRERGECLIVAYSDRAYKEIGTIYQACNALYLGQTNPKNQSNYVINGRSMSGWLVRKKFGTRAMDQLLQLDPLVMKAPLTPKYRYVFVQAARRTKAKVTSALRPMVVPYPNRSTEDIGPMIVADLVNRRRSSDRGTVPAARTSPIHAQIPASGGMAMGSQFLAGPNYQPNLAELRPLLSTLSPPTTALRSCGAREKG